MVSLLHYGMISIVESLVSFFSFNSCADSDWNILTGNTWSPGIHSDSFLEVVSSCYSVFFLPSIKKHKVTVFYHQFTYCYYVLYFQ